MARKARKKSGARKPVEAGVPSTKEESGRNDDDAQIESKGDIPVVKDGDRPVDEAEGAPDEGAKKSSEKKRKKKVGDQKADEADEAVNKSNGKKKKKKAPKKTKHDGDRKAEESTMPFMDTFYRLPSEDAEIRSAAARDLIRHCFFAGRGGVNRKDAAYALTRLLNGVCSGRESSRQGFAACLSAFLRAAHSSEEGEGEGGDGSDAMKAILEEDEYAQSLKDDVHPAMIVRKKLLSTTQFLPAEANAHGKGQKNKNGLAGRMKGIEERDHVFGRLFGIMAVVRSGMLGSEGFPVEVVEGYVKDLTDLYNYKPWMREPSAHALIELLSSLGDRSSSKNIEQIANNVVIPRLLLSKGGKQNNGGDNNKWLEGLTPEQIAVALYLQAPQYNGVKYDSPLDQPLVAKGSVAKIAGALGNTCTVVYPRCHAVWNALWIYLSEEVSGQNYRKLRAGDEIAAIVKELVHHVLLGELLGRGDDASPSNERRSLALQLVCALGGASLGGASGVNVALPPGVMSEVFSQEVIERVFVNVMRASGGFGKKTSKDSPEHYLKPLTARALAGLVERCGEDGDGERRFALAKAFVSANPRFDTKTKTGTVGGLLMLENGGADDGEKDRESLWKRYRSFLEEEILSAASAHHPLEYIELLCRLAKCDLATEPSNEAREVVRFLMSGAFFDCKGLSDGPVTKRSSKKKKAGGKKVEARAHEELSSGLRVKELLDANEMSVVPRQTRTIMSARFYSVLSDIISLANTRRRAGGNKSFQGKASRSISVYRALSEISAICSLLETNGAKRNVPGEESSLEGSKASITKVLKLVDDALVKECDSSGNDQSLHERAVFFSGCASLMISLYLQLYASGEQSSTDDDEEGEDDDGVADSVHEYISDLADVVDGFLKVFEDDGAGEADENPMEAMAGLLVNILSSPVGGENSGSNPTQESASKLTRETVKLAWGGIVSLLSGDSAKTDSIKKLVNEDVMDILVESVVGERAMDEVENGDAESIEEDEQSDQSFTNDAVFTDASEIGGDKGEPADPAADSSESDEGSDVDSADADDVELDPGKLENMLLEDSDVEMNDGGILEHHAGADKALGKLLKLKQEARKASRAEQERIEVCNRLRCADLLDLLFSPSVFKSGWLPVEAILGSLVPILRSRKLIEKNIQASTSSIAKKESLIDRLTALVVKIAKFQCPDNLSSKELALKVLPDIYDEMKHSLNKAHCASCNLALMTAAGCIPDIEDNSDVRDLYVEAVNDWSTRKATKIHSCVFDALIQRSPSLAAVAIVKPLIAAAQLSRSAFSKRESMRLLSMIFKNGTGKTEEQLSEKAKSAVRNNCGEFAHVLIDALKDLSSQKLKSRGDILVTVKLFIAYLKAHDEGILTESELSSIQEVLVAAGDNFGKGVKKNMCSQIVSILPGVARRTVDEKQEPKHGKTPKSSKKSKKRKK